MRLAVLNCKERKKEKCHAKHFLLMVEVVCHCGCLISNPPKSGQDLSILICRSNVKPVEHLLPRTPISPTPSFGVQEAKRPSLHLRIS